MTVTHRADAFTLDEAKFRAFVPYPLEPSDLRGVFTTPAPPRGFDPNKVSPRDLVRAGMLWKRPDAASPPAFHVAWDRVMSRTWRPEDRVVPQFAVQTGKTHHLRTPPVKRAERSYSGTQWAGAGTRGGNWTTVIGYWVIPTVSKPSQPQGTEGGWNSSSWIGVDGFNDSNDVLQAGIQQRVDAQGNPSYVAWYEWFVPAPQNLPPGTPVDNNGYPIAWVGNNGQFRYVYQTNILNFPVRPGQQVYCSVQYINNNTAGQIYFANNDTAQYFSITLAPPPGASFSGQSVEWIMEAPDGGEPTSSLPRFSPVVFTSAVACGANNTSANPASGDILNITNAAGSVTLTLTTVGTDEATVTFIGNPGELLSYADTGTPGNVSDPVVVGFGGWLDFEFLFSGTNASGENRIYAVNQAGQLLSYGDGGTPGNVSDPVVVGFGGWLDFKFLFAGTNASGENRIYAVNQAGQLLSYGDGGTPGNVSDPVVVGFGGWLDFKFLFAGTNASGENRIYAVNQNGQLLSYGDGGTPGNVSDPVVVGFGGWLDFKFLFSGTNASGESRIYAVNQASQLLSYGDTGTPGNVSDPVVVGFGGWLDFEFLFAGRNVSGENRIYGAWLT